MKSTSMYCFTLLLPTRVHSSKTIELETVQNKKN